MSHVWNLYLYLEVRSSKLVFIFPLLAFSRLFHPWRLVLSRRSAAIVARSAALWVTANFLASSLKSCGFGPKIQIQTWKTCLATQHSYLGPLYFYTPRLPSPSTAGLQGESVSCGSFLQAPAEKAISLGVWWGREKNRNQDCLGPETIQVLLHPLQSQLTLNEHPSGKRPRFTPC